MIDVPKSQKRVLVLGPRKSLIQYLEAKEIPYYTWVDDESKLNWFHPLSSFCADFSKNFSKNLELMTWLRQLQEVSHVIAVSEKSVYLVEQIRKTLNCEPMSELTENNIEINRLCTDKFLMKSYLQQFGVKMTPFMNMDQNEELKSFVDENGFPLVLKKRRGSGGRELYIVRNWDELYQNESRKQLLEKYIEGTEGSIESFIQNGEVTFSNITSYFQKRHCNFLPSIEDEETTKEIALLNEKVIKAIGIKWGMTHLEFYKTEHGILFGEIALRPPGGYIMNLLKIAYNIDPWEALIEIELGNIYNFSNVHMQKYALAHIFHPGEGLLHAIDGVDQSEKLPTLKKIKFKKYVGTRLSKRKSAGEEIGYALLAGNDPQEIKKNWEELLKIISFEIWK